MIPGPTWMCTCSLEFEDDWECSSMKLVRSVPGKTNIYSKGVGWVVGLSVMRVRYGRDRGEFY